MELTIVNCLFGMLILALLYACYTDIKRREITNKLNITIALGAPLMWWAGGWELWPTIAIQLGLALGTFLVFALLFAVGMMGGGDVKLLTALALWFAPWTFINLTVIMALTGGLLTLGLMIWHRMAKRTDKLKIPYGVAIAFAGIWTAVPAAFPNFF